MNNFDQQELDKFSKLADEWWNPNGKFKPLHLINPLRVSYIEDKVELKGLDILDIGCGGGILSEALSQKGANVTAIDLADGPLEVEKIRQKESKLDIRYEKKSTSELVDEGNKYDVITCLEMLEHVPDPAEIVKDCAEAFYKNKDVKDVNKGDILSIENVRSIRPGYGMLPKNLNKVLGKKFNQSYSRGTPLQEDMFE